MEATLIKVLDSDLYRSFPDPSALRTWSFPLYSNAVATPWGLNVKVRNIVNIGWDQVTNTGVEVRWAENPPSLIWLLPRFALKHSMLLVGFGLISSKISWADRSPPIMQFQPRYCIKYIGQFQNHRQQPSV